MLHALVPSLVWGFGIHSIRSGHDRSLVQISESAVRFLAIILALTPTATVIFLCLICKAIVSQHGQDAVLFHKQSNYLCLICKAILSQHGQDARLFHK